MTEGRLTKEDVTGLTDKLQEYNEELVLKTGLSLKDIAMKSATASERKVNQAIGSNKIAVIRITAGQGIIENFAEAVQGMLAYMGANVFITDSSDVAGIAESIEQDCNIAFLADDKKFIALNFSLKKSVDNTEATASGYVSALNAMVKGLNGKEVLVIGGAGRVGWNAVLSLKKLGAKVAVVDPDWHKMMALFKKYEICVEKKLEEALKRYKIFFDATPARNLIHLNHIMPDTFIAAPGVPLGLTGGALTAVKERLIHDLLQIGVATMLVKVVSK